MIQLKRAYDRPSSGDGYRVLVDRLWPRGLRRGDARFDAWLKEVAPSDALRRWFGHEPSRFPEFARRYRRELTLSGAAARAALSDLTRLAARRNITLVYAAHDVAHNNAIVLARELKRRLARGHAVRRHVRVRGQAARSTRHQATTRSARSTAVRRRGT
jgi:uncharacterized protein YeaO (DUF488 family)